MNRSEFEKLADSYGGHLDVWPEEDRRRAEGYLEQDPGAEQVLVDLRAVERMLSGSDGISGTPAPEKDHSDLVDRIVNAAEKLPPDSAIFANDLNVDADVRAKARRKSLLFGLSVPVMAGVMMVSLALGVMAGNLTAGPDGIRLADQSADYSWYEILGF